MTTALLDPAEGAQPPEGPRFISRKPKGGDAIFVNTFRAIGASVLVITGGIAVFLAYQGWPTLHHYGFSFFTTQTWNPDTDTLGIAAVIVGTIEVAAVAMVISFPLAIATALYITEYAPPRLRGVLVAAIDLMAAVPSIVYGLWGFFLIEPHASHFAVFLQRNFGWFPPFHVDANPNAAVPDISRYTASAFIAGIVVSMMVMPMACAVMRQVFSLTPEGEKEGALALGSTKWGMIRTVVLPFGRGGIIGGTMLGLGRALGETIAVALLLPQVAQVHWHILENGGATVSGFIARRAGEIGRASCRERV